MALHMHGRYSLIRILYSFITLVLWGLLCLSGGQEYSLPMLDSLEVRQKKEAMLRAPSGVDTAPEQAQPSVSAAPPVAADENSQIEQEVEEDLALVPLEERIQRQEVQEKLVQFGYNLFKNRNDNLATLSVGTIPDDYILGPGDQLIIQLYGKSNLEFTLTVSAEGQILIPDIGPVVIRGMTYKDAQRFLDEKFQLHIPGVKTVVTLGVLKSIRIHVLGAVKNPGVVLAPALSTVTTALQVAGGPLRTGTLRDIKVRRNSETLASIDFYDYLLTGSTEEIRTLRDGDVIFVPDIGKTVGVAGKIKRPAIYELKEKEDLSTILRFCGGLLPSADPSSLHIERFVPGVGKTLIDVDVDKDDSRDLKSGDLVRVFESPKLMNAVVLVTGHVKKPGGYQWREGSRVSDLVATAGGGLFQTVQDYAIISRENKNQGALSTLTFNLATALANPGSPQDPLLQARDQIRIFGKREDRAAALAPIVRDLKKQASFKSHPAIVSVLGAVQHAGDYPWQSGLTAWDMIERAAGGLKPKANSDYIAVFRTDPHTLEIEAFDLSVAGVGNSISVYDFQPSPGDRIRVFQRGTNAAEAVRAELDSLAKYTPSREIAPIVSISGPVLGGGRYPYIPGMTLGDLIRQSGGLREVFAEAKAELSRYRVGGEDSGEYEHKTITQPMPLTSKATLNYALEPADHITILAKPRYKESFEITLKGQVEYPGTYRLTPGQNLTDAIRRAGGITSEAFPEAAVLVRKKLKSIEQASLDRIQGNLDDLLVQLHLSPAYNNSTKFPAGEHKWHVFRVIQQLKQIKAVGRLSINLPEILSGDSSRDIVVEDGDVLTIPREPSSVTVMGEVHYPGSFRFDPELDSNDYVALSGGSTSLAKEKFLYVVQPDGRVLSARETFWGGPRGIEVRPGAVIFIPLEVDRINRLETFQSWTQILYQIGLSAASLSVLGVF